jgi:hypothetical protein
MAHDVRLFDAQRIHQAGAVFSKKPGRVVNVGFIAAAQTAMVVNQNLVVLGKLRHLSDAPRRQADARSGNQHQRISLAIKLII